MSKVISTSFNLPTNDIQLLENHVFTDTYTQTTHTVIKEIIKEIYPNVNPSIIFDTSRISGIQWEIKKVYVIFNINTPLIPIEVDTFIHGGLLYKKHNYYLISYLSDYYGLSYPQKCLKCYLNTSKLQKKLPEQLELNI